MLFSDDDEEDQASQLNSSDLDNCVQYSISDEVKYLSPKITILVLMKRGPVLEAEKDVLQQILYQKYDLSTPYEDLHRYARASTAPMFKSTVKETGRAER